ncbi:MAG: dihydroorotase [Muribaculaceae bacterium]|nr:dihydroorotase [Muribaculaceae bacterium]
MKIIYNGTIVNEQSARRGFVVTDGDLIAQVGFGDPDAHTLQACEDVVDAQQGLILPGVIDTHVHFREPGLTAKATIASESRAAVAGGVTSFVDMPNVVPPTVTLEALEQKQAIAARTSLANYAFYVGATRTNVPMLIHEVDYSRVPGVKVFLGSSTGGMLLDDTQALTTLFSQVPALIAVHSEDEALVRASLHEHQLRYGHDIPMACHPAIRSEEACWQSTRRAVSLAERTGARLHVLHVTTARELQLFGDNQLSPSKRITAEACVGHLWFDSDDYARLGARIKVNPAIKTGADREALRRAVAGGRIDVVSTDHAPHLLSEKNEKYLKSPSGMPLAQFSLIAMLELAAMGCFTPAEVVQKMCHNQACLLGIERRGFLRKGYKADVVVVRPEPQGWTITDADVLSTCGWTPLAQATMHHRVARTWVNGVEVYPRRPHQSPAQPLRFSAR